ncbi:RNA-directed DNA polymerase from retron EC86 [Asticcacaulis biprosthecium C19]|uniref:RNA-directed DNA polymerase n=2 Tax=Asticcacaulis biprosthecium TaxID=76891 RepID=F4QSF6_9CAUL|nr:RNA-directed DNA polymerase from retron EC86 [Asticcacaulis biprosthecium C19]
MSIDLEQWAAFFLDKAKGNQQLISGYLHFLKHCKQKDIPPIFEDNHLSQLLGINIRDLAFYLSGAQGRYRSFHIPKRKGGVRLINTPTPLLLHIQQWILSKILYKLPVSEFAHGGVPGRSIFSNAKAHLGARCVLRIDLKGFFDTVPLALGISIFRAAGYSPNVSRSLALLCFENGCLPQGAATSSTLANLAANSLDKRLSALAKKYGLSYTRYVDDLTFSGRSIGPRFAIAVKSIVEQCRFVVNPRKTQLMRGSSPKFVTGLAVGGQTLRVPRAFRRNVKNQAFQLVKRGVAGHLLATGDNDPLILERVAGKLAFWLQAEPESKTARQLCAALAEYRKTVDTDVSLPQPRRIVPINYPDELFSDIDLFTT